MIGGEGREGGKESKEAVWEDEWGGNPFQDEGKSSYWGSLSSIYSATEQFIFPLDRESLPQSVEGRGGVGGHRPAKIAIRSLGHYSPTHPRVAEDAEEEKEDSIFSSQQQKKSIPYVRP